MSRTSVREALRRLEAEKLVTIIPNRGPSVSEISWEEAQAIYDVRAILEGEVAALLAERATPGQKREMSRSLAAFVEADEADDAIGRLTATSGFYDVMLRGCGNRIIGEMFPGDQLHAS
ncbi:MAG: GntR family transcriptional regulator [Burkholderiales bacterium]|nr:GntR family transcriptional regulator [Burkholderiales bacterium]